MTIALHKILEVSLCLLQVAEVLHCSIPWSEQLKQGWSSTNAHGAWGESKTRGIKWVI